MPAMMRSRVSGRPCRIHGHGAHCEVAQERRVRTRTQENRQWREEEAMRELLPYTYDEGGWRVNPRDTVRATLRPGEYVLSPAQSAELGLRYIQDAYGGGSEGDD